MKQHIYLLTQDITLDGGVERVVCNMANSFSKRGYQVDIISVFQANKHINYNVSKDINIKYLIRNLSFKKWIKTSFFYKSQIVWRYVISIKITRKLYNYIDNTLFHGQQGVLMCNSYLITPLYNHNNVKTIGLDHSRYPFGKLTNGVRHWIHTYMIRKFDIVTTLNRDEITKWNSIGRPVLIMPNYLPDSMFQDSLIANKKEKVILSMGRMDTEQKGFDRLIDAYSLIAHRHSDWKVKIFGSGQYKSLYEKQIENLGLEKNIEIHEYTKSPMNEYKNAAIYAMCSREEGFGMVLLEAGSQGVPIVAYDVEFGPNKIIKESKTGFIIPDGNKKLFAEALEKLMNDEKLCLQMSHSIKEDIKERYSENVIIGKWINIINSL